MDLSLGEAKKFKGGVSSFSSFAANTAKMYCFGQNILLLNIELLGTLIMEKGARLQMYYDDFQGCPWALWEPPRGGVLQYHGFQGGPNNVIIVIHYDLSLCVPSKKASLLRKQ